MYFFTVFFFCGGGFIYVIMVPIVFTVLKGALLAAAALHAERSLRDHPIGTSGGVVYLDGADWYRKNVAPPQF